MSISTAVQKRPDYYHERYREERRTDATRRINATLAELVNLERHDVVRQQLLKILTEATGYRYAMLSEMEADATHLCVVAVHAPPHILQGSEKLLGFSLVGHRVKNLAICADNGCGKCY